MTPNMIVTMKLDSHCDCEALFSAWKIMGGWMLGLWVEEREMLLAELAKGAI